MKGWWVEVGGGDVHCRPLALRRSREGGEVEDVGGVGGVVGAIGGVVGGVVCDRNFKSRCSRRLRRCREV